MYSIHLFLNFTLRMLVRNMDEFSDDKESVKWHIASAHSREMCTQSVVVSKLNEYDVVCMHKSDERYLLEFKLKMRQKLKKWLKF